MPTDPTTAPVVELLLPVVLVVDEEGRFAVELPCSLGLAVVDSRRIRVS